MRLRISGDLSLGVTSPADVSTEVQTASILCPKSAVCRNLTESQKTFFPGESS